MQNHVLSARPASARFLITAAIIGIASFVTLPSVTNAATLQPNLIEESSSSVDSIRGILRDKSEKANRTTDEAGTKKAPAGDVKSVPSATDFSRLTLQEKITELQRQLAVLLNLRDQAPGTTAKPRSDSNAKTKARSGSDANPAKSSSTLSVTTIPLLFGGTVRGGESVPVAYLQVKNTGTEPANVTGFTLRQNGTAPASLITALTTVDDKGGSRATSRTQPFEDRTAFVPTSATIAPGQMKIFSIKANMAPSLTASLGKTFAIDAVDVETNGTDKGAYPLRGTTWTIGL